MSCTLTTIATRSRRPRTGYAVRWGSNPAGVSCADAPVNFTTWFAAARDANANYFLPSINEMYKGSVFNGSGNPGVMSGSWGTLISNVANFSSTFGPTATPAFVGSTSATSQIGFRVASNIAPVPEPETITLASFGIVGLCGASWLKRRRKSGERPAPATELAAA